MRTLILCCLLGGVALAEPTKLGTVEGITEYKLANGLRVLFIPDISQNKVTVNCTIFVGSRHEGYGETGMAHLLEHMVFKGCPKYPDVPKALRDHGADFNGTTNVDRTNYFETMPAEDANLEFGIELEADRMMNSYIAREELMKEFSVVRSEFERGENSPDRVLMQRMMASAYEWHNYGKSTIGNRTDIERVPIESLQAFYKKYYRPDNAMLVVAGRFDEKKALGYIEKYFGPLKNPEAALPKTYTEEPAQDGERVVVLRRVGTTGATGAVYHIPAASHVDFAACDILGNILGNKPEGRLHKALVDKKLATSVIAGAFNNHDPGIMVIGAQTEPAKTEECRDAMIDVLESLAKTPITDDEVKRAKAEELASIEKTLANSERFATGISNWASCGDWRLFFLHRDRLEKVTAADVNRVAQQYLVRSNRTVGTYIPTAKPERAEVAAAGDVAKMVEGYKGRKAMAAGEAFDASPANILAKVQTGTVGDGIKYSLLTKKTKGETVNLELVLRFGDINSLKGKDAVVDLLGDLMERGTAHKSRQQIKDEFTKLQTSANFASSRNTLTIKLGSKRQHLPAALKLVGEILREPSFPASEFEVLQREQVSALEKNKTEPTVLAMNALRRKLSAYPDDDMRATPTVDEAIARLKKVSNDDVKAFHRAYLGGGAGELAIVGDFDPAVTLPVLDSFLKGWKASVPYTRVPSELKMGPAGVEKINTPDKANAMYLAGMAFPIKDDADDYAAMMVGNYLLGQAPLASRLSKRVRGEEGLSYTVTSMLRASSEDPVGQFLMLAIANPKNLGKVDAALADELGKFLKDGMSADELEQGKKAILQSLKLSRNNDANLTGMLVKEMAVGRDFKYIEELEKRIEAVQPSDVKKAFDKYIDPKKFATILAGDLEKK